MIYIFKEILKNYYNLKNIDICNIKEESVEIIQNNINYILFWNNPLKIVEESLRLSQIVSYSNKIVKNIFGQLITKIGSKQYVLIENNKNKKIENNILNLYKTKKLIKLDWRNKWIERSSMIEKNYINRIQGKYALIDESISYYMGLLEMSISLLNEYGNYIDNGYIQHTLLNDDSFNNPLNYIIDIKERDYAEYLKYIFFNKSWKKNQLEEFIKNGQHLFEFDLVIVRLIYPNYYFNTIDDIILKRKGENELKKIIARSDDYIIYTRSIIEIINKINPIKKYPSI